MRTRTVTLTDEQKRFVLERVQSGHYADESAVVRAALQKLEYDEIQYHEKIAVLNKALDEGEASGVAEGNVFQRLRQRYGLNHLED